MSGGPDPVTGEGEKERQPSPVQQQELLEVELTPRQALRTRSFWLLALAFPVWSGVVAVTTIYQIPFMVEEMGTSLVTAASIVSLFSLLTLPGRFIFG